MQGLQPKHKKRFNKRHQGQCNISVLTLPDFLHVADCQNTTERRDSHSRAYLKAGDML